MRTIIWCFIVWDVALGLNNGPWTSFTFSQSSVEELSDISKWSPGLSRSQLRIHSRRLAPAGSATQPRTTSHKFKCILLPFKKFRHWVQRRQALLCYTEKQKWNAAGFLRYYTKYFVIQYFTNKFMLSEFRVVSRTISCGIS